MSSWWALVKKEFMLTRTIFLAALAFIFVVWGFSYVLDYLNAEHIATVEIDESIVAGTAMVGIMTAGVFMHVFYMSIYMIVSMQKELNTFHLWLHTPQPMSKLLSAKLVSGLFCNVVSLFINGTIAFALILSFIPAEYAPSFGNTVLIAGLLGGAMVIASFYLSLYALLFTSVYLALRGKIGKWAWLVVIFLFISVTWLFNKVEEMAWYQALTEWGTYQIYIEAGMLAPIFPLDISVGFILVHTILAIIIFAIATFLIDRKAEV